jgi:hypothetical protein
VTLTELDDIMKILYPEVFDEEALNSNSIADVCGLKNTIVKHIFRQYSSSANKILVDYKKFKEFLMKGVDQIAKDSRHQASQSHTGRTL